MVTSVGLVDDPPQPPPFRPDCQEADMAVQARMFVRTVTQQAHQPDSREVELSAVTRGDEAKEWSQYTPSATLKMWITNPAAHEQFAVGHEFLLTFEDVTPPTKNAAQ